MMNVLCRALVVVCSFFFMNMVMANNANSGIHYVEDIRLLGLQRVSAGTVFKIMDVKANSQLTDVQIQQAVRELFATGLFDYVNIGLEDKVLLIEVKERPCREQNCY